MDDNLYQDDFEDFLRGQVKNHRMYPSDGVWRNINRKLHGEKNWPALTIAAFVILVATVAVCVHFSPKPNIFAVQPTISSTTKNNDLTTGNNPTTLSSVPFANSSKNSVTPAAVKNIAASTSAAAHATGVQKVITSVSPSAITASNRTITQSTLKFLQANNKRNTLAEQEVITIVNNNTGDLNKTESSPLASAVINDKPSINTVQQPDNASDPTKQPAQPQDYNDKNMVDGFLKEHKGDLPLYTTTQVKSLKNRITYLIYIAPSISYRKLTEDESALKSNAAGGPVALNYVTDVNQVVRHKPGTGVEAGVAILYNVSEKFRVKTGFQFNMRQYNIEAYRSLLEPTSIALFTNSGVDTVNTYSTYRTTNGYLATQLVNRYFQIAAPVGIEWTVAGTKRVQLNLAGSIQPTYLLNKNAYLLSTNFKNYTENSGMINSWNINSNIEAFLSFKVGDYKWQLGPQLRYQHLSTFIREYPIKEHLMDYGFKLGVSKVIQ